MKASQSQPAVSAARASNARRVSLSLYTSFSPSRSLRASLRRGTKKSLMNWKRCRVRLAARKTCAPAGTSDDDILFCREERKSPATTSESARARLDHRQCPLGRAGLRTSPRSASNAHAVLLFRAVSSRPRRRIIGKNDTQGRS